MSKPTSLTIGFVLAATLVLTMPIAGASKLEYYGVESEIRPDQSVYNTLVFKFSEPRGVFEHQLSYRIFNLSSESTFPYSSCTSSDNGQGSLVSCDFTGMTDQKNRLTLRFNSMDMVSSRDGDLRFKVNHMMPFDVEESFVVVKLPENGILTETVANESFFPPSGLTASDGRRIYVYWNAENLSANEDSTYSLLYTMPNGTDDGLGTLLVIIAIVIISTMVGVAVYMKTGKEEIRREALIESVLYRDENAIVRILNSHGGKCGQKILVRESGFSKAKVSRIVRGLRDRGIIDIEPISGRENRIMLKEQRPGP